MHYKFEIESHGSGRTTVCGKAKDVGILDMIHAVSSLVNSFELDGTGARLLLIGVVQEVLHGSTDVTTIDMAELKKQMGEVDDEN